MNSLLSSRLVFKAAIMFCVGLMLWLLTASALSVLAVRQLKRGQLHQASVTSHQAATWLRPINSIPYLQFWPRALDLISTGVSCLPNLDEVAVDLALPECWATLGDQLTQLAQSPIPGPAAWRESLRQAAEWWRVFQPLTQGQHRVAVLLQNNQELRAGGGFMGSLILVDLNHGRVQSWELLDIYEPDGQFQGRVEAPPGVAEYLSGGQGWRLPDTNWAADGPTMGQEVLKFLALGGRQDIDLAVFTNASVVESLLHVVGPIQLPDYPEPITANNLFEQARADRETFFAGSYQKTTFLKQLATQLRLQLTQLSPTQLWQIWKSFSQSMTTGDTWFFATDPSLQQSLSQQNLTLSLPPVPSTTDLNQVWWYSLESNVGINKANQQITRQAELSLNQTQATLTFYLENHHPQDPTQRQEYVDYHRLLLPAAAEVSSLSIDDQPLQSIDTDHIMTAAGDEVQQLGFLVTVAEASTTKVQATWRLPQPLQPQLPLVLTVGRQPGMAPFPIVVSWQNQVETVVLDRNVVQQQPFSGT